jgi:FkbM family methyltransferase
LKVFLDVGAHTGETLAAVRDPALGFDRIVCFEPVRGCWPSLKKIADARVTIEPFGLWNRTGQAEIFQPGTKGAGLWQKELPANDTRERCRFVRASDWTRANLRASDEVYLKLNCEGAECDILDDLLDSAEFEKVDFCMVDFDVRKFAALKHRQPEVLARLAAYPFPRVASSKQVMKGETHADRIRHWLGLCR